MYLQDGLIIKNVEKKRITEEFDVDYFSFFKFIIFSTYYQHSYAWMSARI